MSQTKNNKWPVPSFHKKSDAADWTYQASIQTLLSKASQWKKKHHIKAANSDHTKVHLLLIDLQKDFCFPQGTLYVAGRSGKGAIDDSNRIARFIYQNLPYITNITCTLDTHFPFQIFFPAFWVDNNNQAPQAYAEITVEQILCGKLRPNPEIAWWLCDGNYSWLQQQVEFYCKELEKAGKYTLYLWPPHCLLGSDGHSLVGVIQQAHVFHAFVRGSKAAIEVKGKNPLTESYSILAPEVLFNHDGNSLAKRNINLIKTLLEADVVIIAGQAASHCVKSSIEDLLDEINAVDAKLAQKVYILSDCMSAVAIPDPNKAGEFLLDYTQQTKEALDKFAQAGMHIVTSTKGIRNWPDIKLV